MTGREAETAQMIQFGAGWINCAARVRVGAENLRHLGRCFRNTVGSATRTVPGGQVWFWPACDDLRLVGLKLIFLVVTRAVSVLGLSRREAWWKDADIVMLRHQLAVALRERPSNASHARSGPVNRECALGRSRRATAS